ncbi:MAG: hypothetical protein OH363_04940 [Candidatus Parvarchaeota archaeon]|nr:hypothetical protein [Candidatus Jingweiarchaeum tengchongense]
MTLEDLKKSILEVVKSHQKIEMRTLLNLLIDPIDGQAYPVDILQARKKFDQILSAIPTEEHQTFIKTIDEDRFYQHNGSLIFAPFFALLADLTNDKSTVEFFSSDMIEKLRSEYRKFQLKSKMSETQATSEVLSHDDNKAKSEIKTSEIHATSEVLSHDDDNKAKSEIKTSEIHATSEVLDRDDDNKAKSEIKMSEFHTTEDEEYGFHKQLSDDELESARKLRQAGLKVFDGLITDMMESKLDPSLQRRLNNDVEDTPVTNINDNLPPNEQETKKPLKKDNKNLTWIILGLLLLGSTGAIMLSRMRPKNGVKTSEPHTTSEVLSHDGDNKAKSEIKTSEIHATSLSNYDNIDSLSSAVMSMLENQEMSTMQQQKSKDKYADVPSVKELFGPASY